MTDWRALGRAVSARVVYKAVCAGCGRVRFTPVFTSRPQFCNRDCEDAYRDLEQQ